MLQYGPETGEARDLLRRYTALKIALIWPEENTPDGPRLDDQTALEMLESVQAKLRGLTPQSEAQRWLQSRALQIGGDLAEERWLLAAVNEGSVPRPFLVTLVFWLTILFTGFGLFAPRHATVVAALLVCALSLSAAIFLILEMDRPFQGFITVAMAVSAGSGASCGDQAFDLVGGEVLSWPSGGVGEASWRDIPIYDDWRRLVHGRPALGSAGASIAYFPVNG